MEENIILEEEMLEEEEILTEEEQAALDEERRLAREEALARRAEREENVYDRIFGLTAEVNQMERMIAENIRLIAENDDVEGRTNLKAHLENEVRKKRALIAELEKQTVSE